MISASNAAVDQPGRKSLDPVGGNKSDKKQSYPETWVRYGDIAKSVYTGIDAPKDRSRLLPIMKGIDDLQLSSKDLLYSRAPRANALPSQTISMESAIRIEDNNLGTYIDQLQLRIKQSFSQEFVPQAVTYEVMEVIQQTDSTDEDADILEPSSQGGFTDSATSCCITCNLS